MSTNKAYVSKYLQSLPQPQPPGTHPRSSHPPVPTPTNLRSSHPSRPLPSSSKALPSNSTHTTASKPVPRPQGPCTPATARAPTSTNTTSSSYPSLPSSSIQPKKFGTTMKSATIPPTNPPQSSHHQPTTKYSPPSSRSIGSSSSPFPSPSQLPPLSTSGPPTSITRSSYKSLRVEVETHAFTTSAPPQASVRPRASSQPPSPTSVGSASRLRTSSTLPPPSSLQTSTNPSPSPLRTSSTIIPPFPSPLRTSSTAPLPSPLRSSANLRSSTGLPSSTNSRSSTNLRSSTTLRSSGTGVIQTPASSATPTRNIQKQTSQTRIPSTTQLHTPPTPARSTKPSTGTRVRTLSKTYSKSPIEPPPLPKRLSAKTLEGIKTKPGPSKQINTNKSNQPNNTLRSSSNLIKSKNGIKQSTELDMPPPLPPKPNKRPSTITFSVSVDENPLNTSNPLKSSSNNAYIPSPFVPPPSSPSSRSHSLSSSNSHIPRPLDSPTTERRKSRLMKLSAHTKKHKKIKITVVGEPGIGKSNLISRLMSQTYTDEHKPTVFDTHTFLTKFGPWAIQLVIWEPSCTEEFAVKRPVCYPETGIFMICFDLSQPHSFHIAKEKWLDELQTHGYGNTPKIFVGLKQDLSLGVQEEVTFNQSYDNVAEEHEQRYTICECSAKRGEGIDDVFEETIRKFIYYDQEKEQWHWRDVRVLASGTTQKLAGLLSIFN